MGKQTQKQKIGELEEKISELHAIINRNTDIINEMQDKANEQFANSTDKIQMQQRIDRLELLLKSAAHEKELAEAEIHKKDLYIQELKNKNDELNIKIAKRISNELDLKKHIESLEHNLQVAQHFNEQNNVDMLTLRATQQSVLIKKLEKEIKDLRNTSLNQPKHNERGAGRKPIVDDTRRELIKMYRAQGMTIKAIATQENISVGLVHKIVNS